MIGDFEGGGKGHRYTMYTVFVHNVTTGGSVSWEALFGLLQVAHRAHGARVLGPPWLLRAVMLLCTMARSFENCSQTCENIENCIMKSVLQMEHTDIT
ncbi:hypothetical protein CCR75_004328 [Bremia lactucae]|uniref:Uncharacterized protein n=1 Tax=Bremia lactucae TaxID=4779 RepID=A0A976FM72_BRELC|nr:hypothetical protein CCR75_004328 [Bremia lactucae]